jgi:hypothetical protein
MDTCQGHSDDQIPFEELSLPQQLNVRCDELAKIKLIDAIAEGSYIDPVFPFADITVTINNTKTRSSVKAAIYKHWGAREAKILFSRRDKVLCSAFDNIYWDCMGKVMTEFPETFQGWVTRHISDFNGYNRYQSRCGTNPSRTDVPAATNPAKILNTLPDAPIQLALPSITTASPP